MKIDLLIEKYLGESANLNQTNIKNILMKGLTNSDFDFIRLSSEIYKYLSSKSGEKIFVKSGKPLTIMDELWYRLGEPLVKSEKYTDKFINTLKSNFKSINKDVTGDWKIIKSHGMDAFEKK